MRHWVEGFDKHCSKWFEADSYYSSPFILWSYLLWSNPISSDMILSYLILSYLIKAYVSLTLIVYESLIRNNMTDKHLLGCVHYDAHAWIRTPTHTDIQMHISTHTRMLVHSNMNPPSYWMHAQGNIHLSRVELFLQEIGRREPLYFQQRAIDEKDSEYADNNYAEHYYKVLDEISKKLNSAHPCTPTFLLPSALFFFYPVWPLSHCTDVYVNFFHLCSN